MHSLRRFFANAEFVLIDDGFYTFVAYEKFLSKNIFLPFSNYKSTKGKFIKYLYFGNSYKRLLNSENLVDEEIFITNDEYDMKLGEFYYKIEQEAEAKDES